MPLDLKDRLTNSFQKLKDSTTLDERAASLLKPISDFSRPRTGTLALRGNFAAKQFTNNALDIINRNPMLNQGMRNISSGMDRVIRNPVSQIPLQFMAGNIEGSNLYLTPPPVSKPSTLGGGAARTAGSLVGALNPYGASGRIIRGISGATNPLIGKAVGSLPVPQGAVGLATNRIASGLGNVGQGMLIDPAINQKTTPFSAGLDFATGALLGPGQFDNALKPVAKGMDQGRRVRPLHPEDAKVLDNAMEIVNDILSRKNKKGATYQVEPFRKAYKDIFTLADGYLTKAEIDDIVSKGGNNFVIAEEIGKAIQKKGTNVDYGGVRMSLAGDAQPTKVTPIKQVADEGLDLVRQAIYSGDEGAAKAIYNTIDGKKPPFKSLVNEVTSLQDSEIKSVKNVSSNQFGEYEDVVKKFKTLLKRSGESINEAGVLNREHIPMNKFGISSDEVAGALGMSEVKFMEQITKDLDMAGKGTATKQQLARLDKNMAKVKNLVTKLGLDDEFYKINTDQIGRRLGVSAAPGGEMSPKTLRKVKTRSESKAKADFQQWQRAVLEQSGGNRTTRQAVDVIAKNIEQNTSGVGDLTNTKDISNLSKGFNTVYRNFQRVFGDKYPQVKAKVLDPFDKSKGQHISDLEREAGTLYSDVVQGLGIKKGSKESAAVQLYGEGKKSYADLVSEFGKQTADNIVQADKWFRSQYDRLLTEVNQVRGRIYPNNPDKLIPKRNDYYRHFREMREGFGALLNIFDSPGNIAPGLESISESTKPKSKWLSFAQKRLGDKTDVDAVGGFLDYIRSSSYAKNIDPHIQVFRGLRDDLVKATSNVNDPNYGKVNNFINFLDKYANDLSGKTNQADRVFQEIVPGGRRAFAAINWLNNRVKANVILGNVSSSLAQVLNLPQGVASAGRYNAPGLGRTMIEMFSDNKTIAKSDFIKERYSGDVFNKFDTGMLSNTKKFAVWMTGALDEVATKYMWNAHYEKALREGLGNPVKYADDVTRSLVGGRGIGEVPLMQKARTFQMIAPFQLEVGNFWYVMKDMVDKKQFGKLATLFVMTHVMNKGLEAIRGSGGAFDPIQAMIDMYDISQDDEDNKSVRMAGRGAGEVLSNVPLGQSVAAAYPEYGFKVGDSQLPTREALFGDADPTRFGSGLLAMKGLQDPLFKVLPPFGGGQLKKTLTGGNALAKGYSETKSGRIRYPIDQTPTNTLKSLAFGEYATTNARDYFDNNRSVLGENQSELFKQATNKRELYDKIMSSREMSNQEDKIREQVRSGSQSEYAGTKLIYFNNSSEQVESIDIGKVATMPENSNLAKALKEKEVWKATNKVMKADITPEQKQKALQALGVKPEEATYYSIATYDSDIKMAYLKDVLPRFQGNRDAMLSTLAMMRGEVNGERILNDTMIDDLYKQDIIGANEKTMLKKMKFDEETGKISTAKGKGKKIKVPSLISTSQLLTAFNNYMKAKTAMPKSSSSRNLSDLYAKRRQRIQNIL